MSDSPLVSVVVPTYNRVQLIGETVESILTQQYDNLELIVVCDGCTDGTERFVNSLADPRVKVVAQENSGGPARPRNAGVACARGEYVAFCDDDDLWMPEKLRTQVTLMERDPCAALCYAGGVTFGNGAESFLRNRLKRGPRRNHFRALLYSNFILNSSVLVRRSTLAEVGPFNVDKRLHGTEDYEMWLRIAHTRKLVGIDEPLVRYRVHRGNLAGNRARATLRGLYVLKNRSWSRDGRRPGSVFCPMIWQWFKYKAYTLTGY
jgi:glycosyltransferase involved in cell wall biosynthesis